MNFVSNCEQDTLRIGKRFATTLDLKSIVILSGDLGMGKTRFVEGVLNFFGITYPISSPTFNIVNEYNIDSTNIYHFDVYRLKNIDEFYDIGGEEYFESGICLIEWGETIEEVLPLPYTIVSFKKDDTEENKRIITIEKKGKI